MGNMSEEFLQFSRMEQLLRLIKVKFHDEEDKSISSTLHDRRTNTSLVQHLSILLSQMFSALWIVFLPLIGSQNLSHPIATLVLRADIQ